MTTRVRETVAEFRAGKVEYRNDKGGNLHIPVGKKSFEENALAENIEALIEHIKSGKPAGAKGAFMQRVYVCSTMSPSVEIDLK